MPILSFLGPQQKAFDAAGVLARIIRNASRSPIPARSIFTIGMDGRLRDAVAKLEAFTEIQIHENSTVQVPLVARDGQISYPEEAVTLVGFFGGRLIAIKPY